ncbi:L-2-amino-thiazoline-4-carboxylic acid hydrolase [Massilibacteroides vaginae]|uniref:L-2-amino-thiazoline-4-carboxylic acid hydrolase n=1 Tax=Massilibacteroides vaginae TaxID=1673718 RepID=UPI000A1C9E5A|nr:L-2-amino-thiazoline-4-carboxylic acid hydrolase [Massilibacteroides vaginae]
MISCTEFIPAYSEGFKFLEQINGKDEVKKFWKELSEIYLKETLSKLILEKGLEGCFEYWSQSLNEEAADFTMILDQDKEEFKIDMHKCPSRGMLTELKHMIPYHSYCDHCEALYRPIVEKAGYTYETNVDCGNSTCNITIKKQIKNQKK